MRSLLLLGTAIPVLALTVASLFVMPRKLIYNASDSAPIGLYWIDKKRVSRGNYVLVQIPKRVRNLVKFRQYLPPDIPLLKRVVGIKGDQICRQGQVILINGIAVATAQITDQIGRDLPIWQGCYILTEDQIFLLQDHPQSFDGRYFGPVDRGLIIGRATRLWFPFRKPDQS